MDLTSICLATQQTLALHRLCCHDSKLEIIRQMLCKPTTNGAAKAEPRWTQLFLWQSAIMLLNIGIVLFLIGLVIQIITDLSEVYSHENKKVCSVYIKEISLLITLRPLYYLRSLQYSRLLYICRAQRCYIVHPKCHLFKETVPPGVIPNFTLYVDKAKIAPVRKMS